MSERMARPPAEQWWTINGQAVIDALQQAHDGTEPSIVYLELLANSDGTDYGATHDLRDVADELGVHLGGAERAHDLLTIPGDEGRPQRNTCRRCGAYTLGPWLPELPCPAEPEESA